MRKKIKIFLAIIIILLAIAKMSVAGAIYIYPPIVENDVVQINSKNIIKLTNDYRTSLGLNPLKEDPRLDQAAVNKARDILTGGFFDHTSPEGKKFSDWIKDVDYKYFYVGENLAIDFQDDDSVFQAWIDSPEHYDNIVKTQYQEIGVSAVKGKMGKRPTIVVVQLFGSRVLGTNSSVDDQSYVPSSAAQNYFYETPAWQKLFSLEKLQKSDIALNYLLTVTLTIFFFIYERRKLKNQINIKQPIINRYQANAFRE
ncbi:MAG: CAP domain-containing protein [Candidatus Buchananbacteria bacterium]